ANTALKYRTGQNVKHTQFGEGIVIDSKWVGNDEITTVAFQSVGVKRILATAEQLSSAPSS
ncbi:MAG TPA: hypothetical protein PK299_09890, partial [Anaerolineales bacterium]|nr:hypothetical protein [Anaerolineales bacterium]